jgi:hypothetical protein
LNRKTVEPETSDDDAKRPTTREQHNFDAMFKLVGILVAIIAIAFRLIPRAVVPPHLANHQVYAQDDLIPKASRSLLLDTIRDLGTFGSNMDTTSATGFVPTYEHIGEAVPINPDGSCSHYLLLPNPDRTKCILPERMDVGKHFIMTGGLDGVKEPFDDLISRVSSFARYTFLRDLDKFPIVKELFESDNFQNAAKSVCPADRTYLDPFQFTFLISVPGQTVAMHLDAPYFWGASRFRFPQWLLVSMEFSGLFQEQFIHQIQVVSYLHEWPKENVNPGDGGDFVYYSNSSYWGTVTAKPGSGTIVDGSKVLHAAKIFRPEVKAPHLPKDKPSKLVYVGEDRWELQVAQKAIRTYTTQDLRISMVYRARCFASAEEAQTYADLPEESMMTLEGILDTLKRGLVARKAITAEKLETISKLELAFLIVDTYIKYPLPPLKNAWIPYNYCALPRLLPWTAGIINYLC